MSYRACWVVASIFAVSLSASLANAQAPKAGQQGKGKQAGAGMMTPEMQARLLKQYDKNGNGKLDPDEQQAARKAMQERMQANGGGKGGPAGKAGTGGKTGTPGQPGAAGMNPEMKQKMLDKFDKNGNGKLDPDELQAARQAMQANGGGKKKS